MPCDIRFNVELLAKFGNINYLCSVNKIQYYDRYRNYTDYFRSATHYGSYVLLTELLHESKNFVLAIETNRAHGKLNELLSKPQSNSVDVRKQLISAAKIIELFKSSKKS